MRINPIVYGVMVIVVFFGIILGFQAAGIWSISGKVDNTGGAIQPSAADVNTIKGWMTLDQITTTFNFPLAELLKQFSLPSDTSPATALKDLESDSFDITILRTWLQSRSQPGEVKDPQFSSTVPALAPTQAVTATSAEIMTATPVELITATPAPTQHIAPTGTVTGKTTFQELLDWGVSKDAIQKVIGSDMPAPSTVIKDFVTGKGMEFTAVKTQLQTEVDKAK